MSISEFIKRFEFKISVHMNEKYQGVQQLFNIAQNRKDLSMIQRISTVKNEVSVVKSICRKLWDKIKG